MINSKDTEMIKGLVISALSLPINGDLTKYIMIKHEIATAFNIVIKEMQSGGI